MDFVQKHHRLLAEHLLIIACNLDGFLRFIDSAHRSRERNELGIATRAAVVGNDPGQCGLQEITRWPYKFITVCKVKVTKKWFTVVASLL